MALSALVPFRWAALEMIDWRGSRAHPPFPFYARQKKRLFDPLLGPPSSLVHERAPANARNTLATVCRLFCRITGDGGKRQFPSRLTTTTTGMASAWLKRGTTVCVASKRPREPRETIAVSCPNKRPAPSALTGDLNVPMRYCFPNGSDDDDDDDDDDGDDDGDNEEKPTLPDKSHDNDDIAFYCHNTINAPPLLASDSDLDADDPLLSPTPYQTWDGSEQECDPAPSRQTEPYDGRIAAALNEQMERVRRLQAATCSMQRQLDEALDGLQDVLAMVTRAV